MKYILEKIPPSSSLHLTLLSPSPPSPEVLVLGFEQIADEFRKEYDKCCGHAAGTSRFQDDLTFTRKQCCQMSGRLQELFVMLSLPWSDMESLFRIIDDKEQGTINLMQTIVFLTGLRGEVEKADIIRCWTTMRRIDLRMKRLERSLMRFT